MNKGKNQHIVKHSDGCAGNEKATKVADTQKEAIDLGREIAKNQESELIIHEKMGRSDRRILLVMTIIHQKGKVMSSIKEFIYENDLRPADAIKAKKIGWEILDHYAVYIGQDENGEHYFMANSLSHDGVRYIMNQKPNRC